MTTSDGILRWLDKNKEWFKVSAICKKVKIDKGNFSKYKKEGIPEKYLQPIMEVIMPLGFTLDEVIKENNKPENKKKIKEERDTENQASKSEKNISIMSEMEKQFQEILKQKQNGTKKTS